MNDNNEVLVRVENVSKKFCRSLKKSLWYGVKDMASELLPFGRSSAADGRSQMEVGSLSSISNLPSPASSAGESPISHLPSPSPRDLARDEDLRPGEFYAVRDVSFELKRGECLGLIGRNGAGKTTLLKMLNGLIKPDHGRIEMRGRVGALIALGAGFNPILTGRENIYVNGSVLGLTKREIDAKIEDIIDFADIREFIDSPVQSYSSGMQVRLGFAVATALEPDVLILDEVLSVGDVAFRAKCFKRIGTLSRNSAILFVSHDHGQIVRVCDQALLMSCGKPVFYGTTLKALERYNTFGETSADASSTILMHDEIESFIFSSSPPNELTVTAGQPLTLSFRIKSRKDLATGVCLVHFFDRSGTAVGQADFTGLIKRIPQGDSMFNVNLTRLDLAHGKYTLNIAIFSSHKRDTLIHVIGFGIVNVIGAPHLWCAYKIPVANVSVSEV